MNCIFYENENTCRILKTKECNKCKFAKTKNEFEFENDAAILSCRKRGLCEKCIYIEKNRCRLSTEN